MGHLNTDTEAYVLGVLSYDLYTTLWGYTLKRPRLDCVLTSGFKLICWPAGQRHQHVSKLTAQNGCVREVANASYEHL